jgi:myo-inositol 2-dehydrogenase / D-chiro-inositol 1-dehydrogenase
MNPKRIRVALIGAGGWGWQHARVLAADPRVDFCALSGRNEEKTRRRAEEFGVHWYVDVGEMLDREKPDLVNISLPNEAHFAPTLQVIQAGYPLFVEKPLVFDLQEADTLLVEAEKRGLFFGINFNHRYATPVQKTNAAVEAGRLGEIVFATWRFGGEGPKTHPYNNLIETQCHGFDMLEHLCGPIGSVMAQMTDKTGKGFTTLAVALRFQNGAVGSLVGSYDTSYVYPDTHMVEVNGTLAHCVIHDTVRSFTFQHVGNETREVWQAGYFNDRDREFHRTFDRHWEAVVEAFVAGHQPPIHARAGRRALELALAVIESSQTGQRVSLPPG